MKFECIFCLGDSITLGYEAYARLARDIGVDYLHLFREFLASPRYQAALLAGDKVHPGDDGYAMIAERIAAWEPWREAIQGVNTA